MDHTTRLLSPIPMDDRILQLALQMKQAGLPWEPEVGCFVWDREEVIAQPSPFPKRIQLLNKFKMSRAPLRTAQSIGSRVHVPFSGRKRLFG